MTDQNKPRPKVTSHITSTPSHSPSTTYKASIRAKVTPSAITASQTPPGARSEPSLRSTPSSSSLRSHVSASSAGTPRTGARSPLQRTPSTPAPVPQARVTKPFQAQRSPLTPGFAPSSGRPSSSSSSVSASGVASGTPVAAPRVRAAKSALGVSSVSNSSASKRKNNTESGSGSRSRSRSGNDDGSEYEQTPDVQVRRYAADKATSTVGTNGRIDRAPRARVKLQPQPQTQAQTGLQPKSSSKSTPTPSTSSPSPSRSSSRSAIHAAGTADTPTPPVRPANAGNDTENGSGTPSSPKDSNSTTSALGIVNAYLSSSPWPRIPSPEHPSPEREPLPHAVLHRLLHHHYRLYTGPDLDSLPLERSRSSTDNLESKAYTLDKDQALNQPQNQNQNQSHNQGTHLPPHVPYHLLTHPTASAPVSPIHYSQLQDPDADIQAQDEGPNVPSALSSTSITATSFTVTRRMSKPRLPPMVLHPSERQQALKEGRKIVGTASVGSGMRMMPGSPEMKTVELPALTPRVPGTPVLAGQGNGEWKDDELVEEVEEEREAEAEGGGEGENGHGNGEEYQYRYENGNDNEDNYEHGYEHRYEYNDNENENGNGNGEIYTIENGQGNREKSTEQEEVTNKIGVEGEGIKSGRVGNEVEIEAGTEGKGREEQEVDDMLGTDAVEAKINRKIADLEISNASLLAINQALETTKSKQRAEIGKLRRRLRETLAFPHLDAGGASGGSASTFGRGFGAGFGGSHSNSGLDLGASTLEDEPEREHDFDLFLLHEAEMADPQLDARWCKMEDLVLGMKKAAEEAVRRGEEEGSREGRGRVLGWAEMEEMRDMGDGDASYTSEGMGERFEEEEGTVS
ncbi:hypothetical protein L804_02899 [Cryptococcus deuterogattii 2001/935-1]|nr:hypothetical protein L804_02899 [Cryptococcus deuterogattii 2001/935-1]